MLLQMNTDKLFNLFELLLQKPAGMAGDGFRWKGEAVGTTIAVQQSVRAEPIGGRAGGGHAG